MTETTDARKRRLEGERVAGDAVAEVLAAHATPATLADPLPPGTWVLAWPLTRNGSPLVTRTRGECWTLGGGERVVAVEGYSGGIALTHVDVLPIAPLLDQARAEGAADLDYWIETWKVAANSVIRLQGDVETAHAERDRLRAAVEALADECASSACIHLNDMYARLRALLASEPVDGDEGGAT